jgi:tetratricopeptide (TPR) repeat protein
VINDLSKDLDTALNAIDRALAINPSSAVAYYFGAQLNAWGGHSVTATEYAQRALRLSPFDPEVHRAYMALGVAALHEGSYDDAAKWWSRCERAKPTFGTITLCHALTLALAGRIEEARQVSARGLDLDPTFRVRTLREIGFAPAITDKFVDAARLLAIPD